MKGNSAGDFKSQLLNEKFSVNLFKHALCCVYDMTGKGICADKELLSNITRLVTQSRNTCNISFFR